MKYREILEERNKYYKEVCDLKEARNINAENNQKNNAVQINNEVKKSKFKYNFYNQLLKERGRNSENKN